MNGHVLGRRQAESTALGVTFQGRLQSHALTEPNLRHPGGKHQRRTGRNRRGSDHLDQERGIALAEDRRPLARDQAAVAVADLVPAAARGQAVRPADDRSDAAAQPTFGMSLGAGWRSVPGLGWMRPSSM